MRGALAALASASAFACSRSRSCCWRRAFSKVLRTSVSKLGLYRNEESRICFIRLSYSVGGHCFSLHALSVGGRFSLRGLFCSGRDLFQVADSLHASRRALPCDDSIEISSTGGSNDFEIRDRALSQGCLN